jgi:hypothetical protein
MKDATGGGDAATVAPEPVAAATDPATAPAAGAQPAAPTTVTGGGEAQGGGAATCYQPAPEPVACGQWVPAPVATGPQAPTTAPAPTSGPDTPPDPIAAPAEAPATTGPAATTATTPASQMSTWPEWQQHFTRLGLSQDEVAKLGAANLTDAQLAEVYETIHADIVAQGGVPGETPIPGSQPTSAWSPQWEQRFTQLGLPAEFVAEIKAEAMRTGADDAKLALVYEQLAAKAQGQQPTTGPQAPTTQQPAADQPGWNPQVEAAFRSLGMPDEVIKLYAESGAPLAGLEAAYKHAAGRVEDFTNRGWMEKFQAAGVPPLETWSAMLGDQPAKDEDLQTLLNTYRKGQQSLFQKGGQLATSLFPGGRLLQYAFGKEFVSGEEIDRTDWKEIGFAALSGLAAFTAIRGGRNIMAGWKARSGGFAALNGVNDTLVKAGLPAGGVASVQDAAMGATQTWGTKQKLLSLIPGTKLHREIVGLGHAEAAARAFNNGGAASILKSDADGALQMATITKMFDDVKSGAIRMQGGKFAYLGPFKKGPLMTIDVAKGVVTVNKSLKMGNGNSQLVGLMEVAGQKLGAQPQWLGAGTLASEIAGLSAANQKQLGSQMAGNLAREIGGFTNDGRRPLNALKQLAESKPQGWYTELANITKGHRPVPQMPEELFSALATHRLVTGLFDEAGVALTKLDRSALGEGVAPLLDDAVAKMDDARVAIDAAKAGGTITDEAAIAVQRWEDAVVALSAQDDAVARTVFASYVDESKRVLAQVGAMDAVKQEWLATAASQVDDVIEGAAPVVDDVVETVAAGADDVAKAATETAGAMPVATAAADDVVEGAAIRTATAPAAPAASPIGSGASTPMPRKFTGSVSDYIEATQRRTSSPSAPRAVAPAPVAPAAAPAAASSPLSVTVNARGEAVTGSGLVLPSWTSVGGAALPTNVTDPSIARLAEAMARMRG